MIYILHLEVFNDLLLDVPILGYLMSNQSI